MKITVTQGMRDCLLRIHEAMGTLADPDQPMTAYVQAHRIIEKAQEELTDHVRRAVVGGDASCVFCRDVERKAG